MEPVPGSRLVTLHQNLFVSLPSNTTEENDMAKVAGLNARSARWYVRILIPEDLQATYGKRRVNLSLGTSDCREAALLATLKRSKWLAGFESKRCALTPSPVAAVSPELARLLAERVRATVLGQNEGTGGCLHDLVTELVRNPQNRTGPPQRHQVPFEVRR